MDGKPGAPWFSDINTAGSSSLVNGYGIALIWGDTVGNTTYATQQRVVMDPVVTFNSMRYEGTFVDATIPEPASFVVWGLLGLIGLYGTRRR